MAAALGPSGTVCRASADFKIAWHGPAIVGRLVCLPVKSLGGALRLAITPGGPGICPAKNHASAKAEGPTANAVGKASRKWGVWRRPWPSQGTLKGSLSRRGDRPDGGSSAYGRRVKKNGAADGRTTSHSYRHACRTSQDRYLYLVTHRPYRPPRLDGCWCRHPLCCQKTGPTDLSSRNCPS